jgi:diaminopimelate decarboxylase
MHHFTYRGGVLHAEEVPIPAIAETVGTPFYCYSTATLERHYRVFKDALPEGALVCYSLKANSNQAVVKTLARLGAGADVVSAGELKRARLAGVPASRIVFSGVGKTKEELAQSLDAGIYQFNVESEAELELLSALADARGLRAPVALRINPDVDPKTHAKIATGQAHNKFGIPWRRARAAFQAAAQLSGIEIVGLDVHIGSQITALAPFEAAFSALRKLVSELRADGHRIARLDLGGGLGVPYDSAGLLPPHPDEYGKVIRAIVGDLGLQLITEPGRLIAGNAGILVARVVYTKEGEGRRFVVLDAGMNDLIRPALYDAAHEIIPVREVAERDTLAPVDVVGPVCESADLFARDRMLPLLEPGALVAFLTAGAYGAVQTSTYNTRPLVPETLVRGRDWAVVRPRLDLDEIIGLDRLPPWLVT